MGFYEISGEDLQQVLAYANKEEGATCDPSLVGRVIGIAASATSNMSRELVAARKTIVKMQAEIDRLKLLTKTLDTEGLFVDLSISPLLLAKAILWLLKDNNMAGASRTKVSCLLYEAYASWLARNRERISSERPHASEWGPSFWTLRNFSANTPVSRADFEAVAEKHAGIAVFLRNVVRKYGAWSDASLKSRCTRTAAFRHAMPENNGGRWGKELDDTEIVAWRKEL